MTIDSEDPALPYEPSDDEVQGDHTLRVKERHEDALLAIEGVVGVGVGTGPTGDDAIVVYLRETEAAGRLPDSLEGVDVVPDVTGDVDAY